MNIFQLLILVAVCCLHSSHQQQFNRQQQGATHSLAYSDSELNAQYPIRPTTTEAPETTTKKKGFFSGFASLFKGNKDETTTTERTTSTTTTTTPKIVQQPTTSTTTVRTTSTTIIKIIPTFSTSQRTPSRNDDFPPLPPPSGQPSSSPSRPQQPSNIPNAWNVRPQIPTDKPVSFFTQPSATTTTYKPPAHAPTSSDGKVTDAELLTLSDSLFSKDINNAFRYVTVNYQGRTQSSATEDVASQPLLQIDEKLNSMNTVEKMKLMFNNYEQDTSINEYVTPIERKEETDFIDAVLLTPVMRHAMSFLQQKGIVTADPATHREHLRVLWFNLYSRGQGKIGSSGFEHVFLSEVKNGTVLGLHNWIYFGEEEKSNDLDYKGWLKKIDLGNKGQIAKVRFALNGIGKPSNSLFIGTSPELELALYTVCFSLRADQACRMSHGGKDFNIVTHTWKYRGKNLIGSAYPEI